jgi:hypothetical protein
MKIAYGLDLAGYSTGKSSLAKATFDGATELSVVVYRNHPFAERLEGWETVEPLVERERLLLRSLHPLYVDVPIDLQGLPNLVGVRFTWQLTKRSVDFAFNALPPLADRLGSPVARLAYLLGAERSSLGSGLYETYPAASLIPMLGAKPSYKRKTAKWKDRRWIGDGGLADILRTLQVEADDGVVMNGDHFDSAVCAITGVLPAEYLLQGTDLEREIRRRLEQNVSPEEGKTLPTGGPTGYVLIHKKLPKIQIQLRFQGYYDENEALR